MIVVLLAMGSAIVLYTALFLFLYWTRGRCPICGYIGGFHASWCRRGRPS